MPNYFIVANATSANGTRINYTNSIIATDNVDTNIHHICLPIASGHVFPIGKTIITCTAKDNSNNIAKASFVVIVEDKGPPRIQVPNYFIVANATSANGTRINYTNSIIATDNVDTNIHHICLPIASGHVFPIGKTIITCTAKDNSNNIAKASFVVIVEDKIPPRIQVPILANATDSRIVGRNTPN